ncbi:LOW QUALITY PROTEIN: Eburicol 14-alpha-demethylase [Purpureocillium lavendulum]|uniref:Eburicol 14-alpha-demethylase n=1 Tax=Purpureocillium lavendulum TaxID=1247861 RepID=A0AB34G2Q0_9HYPO|nr:LOW QUALITY PROTEIN: Eburicol 14-alpha-demethylase [Purpureocillium lavendulum]
MGAAASHPLAQQFHALGLGSQIAVAIAGLVAVAVALNVASQLLFTNPNEPPLVFHWFPFVGSTITYGMDPPTFFRENRAKHGDVFTFVLLGKKTTVAVGPAGNDFILNGKLKDVNAEEIYTVLTTPVFGRDVVYDCPNAKLMEQKKFMKIALTTEAFRSYVPIISGEVQSYFKKDAGFKGKTGVVDMPKKMAEVTIFTASHALQGSAIRAKFDTSLAALYHDLDMGFTPINFMLHWAPLPWNRKRDHAQRTVAKIYMDTIQERRANKEQDNELDMMKHLMNSSYKNGTPVPDHEVAHMMIALLMAGQHSSSSTSSWIMLRLAQNPQIMEELYQEQVKALGADLPPLSYEDLAKLPLNQAIVKETLRLHAPIHSIMRAVKQPMPVPGTKYVIPTSHTLLAAPGVSASDPTYFPNPHVWDPHRWEADSPNAPTIVRNAAVEDEEKIDYGYGLVSKGAASPYLPFGAGRHRCIGEHFANVQLQTIVAETVRLFKFSNVDGGNTLIGTDYASLFSRPLEPANLRMTEAYGPLVRLWGIQPSQLPPASAGPDELTPFLTSILREALPFIAAVPSTSITSQPTDAPWKPHGVKTYPGSTSPVHLYERTVSAAELTAVRPGPETWVARRSVHDDAPARGTASWDEWTRCFKEEHAEAERKFTPTVLGTRVRQTWDCAGVQVQHGGDTWTNWTLKVEESTHKLPTPLRNRLFPVLQATAAVAGRREFLVVQIATTAEAGGGGGDGAGSSGTVLGAYTSVERVRDLSGADAAQGGRRDGDGEAQVEWVMGTVSDARGLLPGWVQKMAVPGQVAKDVDMFLSWIAEERTRNKKTVESGGGAGGEVQQSAASSLAETVLTTPSYTAASPSNGGGGGDGGLGNGQGAPPPKFYAEADALAKMTVELGLRAVASQAERLERELRDVVAATAHGAAFRREHECRLADVMREVLAVKARVDEVPPRATAPDVDVLLERCRREAAEFREQVRGEVGELRTLISGVASQLDSFPTPTEAEAMLAGGVAGDYLSGSRATARGDGFASACRTECSAQAPKRRIQEAINSTRRWHSDRKTSRLPDAQFVTNYLKQQSKRDPGMAVFIQRAIQRRVKTTRRRRLSSRPRSLEEFCRDVTWRDVEEAVADALVHHEKSAIRALR